MDRRTYLKGTLGLAAGVLLPAGIVGLSGRAGTAAAAEVATFGGGTMGTRYSVQLAAGGEGVVLGRAARERLAGEVRILLDAIDANMSTYRAGSELSRLNASADGDWLPVSAPLAGVVGAALETSALSSGAFDATVGPLVNLWGFGPDGTAAAAPPARELARARERVGYANVELALDADGARLRKRRADAYLDLSGIAKGHAVDRVAGHLETQAPGAYLVEIGGELRARGRKPDGTPWRVAIERPTPGRRAVYRVVALEDAAIATSGDYRNFFDAGGQRFSHSIDPRSGRPVAHGLASVSVVAPTTMEADALSTALMILGPGAGPELARARGIAAHFVARSATGRLEESYTDAFARRLLA